MVEREAVLALDAVAKEYGDVLRTRALDGVDLVLARGELTALIGPSGSGKSTLLHIVGLLDRPTSGRVVLAGKDTTELDERERTAMRAHTLGFVFQFHHLLPAFTALENVMMPLLARHGRAAPWMAERARALLEAVGLGDLADRRPAQLSGGQQQRVAVARALVGKPALVLADEPTGNLDTHTSDEIFALLRRIAAEEGGTFLLVTHDRRLAERCDRILTLVDGRIVSDERRGGAAGEARS